MSTISENLTLTSVQTRSAIKVAFTAKRPVFLWGPAGIGKSEVVASVTQELGGYMIDLRMAQMEPTDIRGIPFYNKDINLMDWAPPIDLPTQELADQYPVVVLFLDEMNSAAPAVQAAAYQLILNRRIGKYVLPDNVVMVAAGNREGDKGVTYRMPMPLANRFIHLEMRADPVVWLEWAVRNNIHKDVVGFIEFAKNELSKNDAKTASRAFQTPRTWTFVSQFLENEDSIDEDTLSNLIAGTVGEGVGIKFMAHRKHSKNMPKPADILSGKVTTLATKEISAMYSLTTSMCYELRDASNNTAIDKKTFHQMMHNFLLFMMNNFEAEMVTMGARTALKTFEINIDHIMIKCFPDFQKKYGKYIFMAAGGK